MSKLQDILGELASPPEKKKSIGFVNHGPFKDEESLDLWINRERYATESLQNFVDCYGGNIGDSIGALGE